MLILRAQEWAYEGYVPWPRAAEGMSRGSGRGRQCHRLDLDTPWICCLTLMPTDPSKLPPRRRQALNRGPGPAWRAAMQARDPPRRASDPPRTATPSVTATDTDPATPRTAAGTVP